MSGPTFTGTLVGSDGSKLIIRDGELVPADVPVPVPDPVPVLIPDGVNTIRVGAASYPLAAVNPTRADYPGGRGPDELVAYQRPTGHTVTNVFGAEVTVMAGQVIAAVDRQATGQTTGVIVPVGGYVLSGHGKARAWLLANAVRGARVELATGPAPTPEPEPVPTPSTPGGRTVAIYRKDGSGSTASLPSGLNQFRYSFFQGTSLVEWGGETITTQAANLARWLDAGTGRDLLISVGGSKGSVSTSNRGAFLGGFLAAEAKLAGRVTGIDWDLEAAALVVDDVVAISKALAEGRKDSYLISFAPPGGPPVAPALQAAVQLHKAGYRVQAGSQLYEAPSFITEGTALGALQRAVDAGLPPSCVVLGTMVGADYKHWTVDMCAQVARAALRRWPDFGGAYLWSEGNQAQDQAWATAMAAVFA